VLPRFSAHRMVDEYLRRMYIPALRAGTRLDADDRAGARALAAWKARVHRCWPGVELRWLETPPVSLHKGEALRLRIAAALNGLGTDDVRVECLMESQRARETSMRTAGIAFEPRPGTGAETLYELELVPPADGQLQFRVHAFPWHPLLAHPFECGLQRWL